MTSLNACLRSLKPLARGLPIAWLRYHGVLTALAHFVSKRHHSFLKRKCNPLRWIEYAVTASLMWLVLAQAFAFVEVNSLVLSTAMIALTMASGIQCSTSLDP